MFSFFLLTYFIPLHNHDIVSVHFNHFYCMEICNKLRRDLAMVTYIYLCPSKGLTANFA